MWLDEAAGEAANQIVLLHVEDLEICTNTAPWNTANLSVRKLNLPLHLYPMGRWDYISTVVFEVITHKSEEENPLKKTHFKQQNPINIRNLKYAIFFLELGLFVLKLSLVDSCIFLLSVMMAPFNRAWAQLKEGVP